MKKCKNCKAVAGPAKNNPAWYKSLIPSRKTINKWLKRALKAFKVEIVIGESFKWILFILIWVTIFPGSIATLLTVLKYAAPLL